MADYSIEIVSTDLPGNNGHAGVHVVDSSDRVIASIHGGPATGVGSSQSGFGNSTYRDDVPLVVNMGGGNYSLGDQGYIPEHRETLVSGLTRSEALSLLNDGGQGAQATFGNNTAYQAAYHPVDLPLYERITGIVVAGNQNALYQNSNSVAYVVAREVEFYAKNVYEVGVVTPIDWESWPVELPGYLGGQYGELQRVPSKDHCFLSLTPITMWPRDPGLRPRADGTYDEARVRAGLWIKPIAEIAVGDVVLSYDDAGRLVPGPVTRTMTNHATHILDFWGTGVTPGHAYLCAGGRFEGQHVPLMDILRSDGAIMRADGTKVRAATGCEVCSEGDRLVEVVVGVRQEDGHIAARQRGRIRLGTRVRMEGKDFSLADVLASHGIDVTEDGLVQATDGGESMPFHWPFGQELPKPEDYILARSNVTLEAIYAAGEWEQIKPRMAAPESVAVPATDMGRNPNPLLQPARPEPNVPPAFAHLADAPRAPGRALNRKQRKAQEARARKAAKVGRVAG